MSIHIVSSIETPDFGGMTLRVGNLNGDGEIIEELEIPQSYCGTYNSEGIGGINTEVHYCYRGM